MKIRYCSICVNPMNQDVINPQTGDPLKFFNIRGEMVCEICRGSVLANNFPDRKFFDSELDTFLSSQNRVLFAHSGGLDSSATLFLLSQKCREMSVKMDIFSVLTGVKGRVARENIESTIRFIGRCNDHFYVDITDIHQTSTQALRVFPENNGTKSVYRECLKRGVLPCGGICNSMIDQAYARVMHERSYDTLITGGDTPKKNSSGTYSLFWEKRSGITILRGAYAFGLSKDENLRIITQNKIPWEHPRCGGYDTDCLVPGAYFADQLNGHAKISTEECLRRFPIILDYLSERVRFGVIDRKKALQGLRKIDVSSLSSYIELRKML